MIAKAPSFLELAGTVALLARSAGRRAVSDPEPARRGALTAFVDTNVLALGNRLRVNRNRRPPLLLRALEVYDVDRLDSAEAYLVAQAEATGVGEVLSFDRSIDKVKSLTRRKP